MAAWVKNMVMLLVSTTWGIYVLVNVFTNKPIDVIVWGVPGAVYLALNPSFAAGPRRGDAGNTEGPGSASKSLEGGDRNGPVDPP